MTAVVDDAVTASPGASATAATVPAIGLVSVANGSLLCPSVTFAVARSIAAWSATIVAAVTVVVSLSSEGACVLDDGVLVDGVLADGALADGVSVDGVFGDGLVDDSATAFCSSCTARSSAAASVRSACCSVSVAVWASSRPSPTARPR